MITLVLSSALYWASCRRVAPGLETGSFFIGLAGGTGLCTTFWGATKIVYEAPSGPPADTSAFLLLLAASVGVTLLGAFFLNPTRLHPNHRSEVSPPVGPVGKPLVRIAGAAALAVAVLAILGTVGILHLSLVKAVAWAYLGVGYGLLAAGAIFALVFIVMAVIAPGNDSGGS
ncbi:hypothetical protein GCM10011583_72670 [Streptomyces camponoticapitis]|uniref:Tripartite tricarboxylate transporter TctB family protein n=1 Tax=Streptomyces camponoticapitis TaxID=1616125 RepID=A0ABQ2F0Q2_9ACTN|nr:hypothetical protein GCM10011583_72670 [Streptomyces camponoticapitis]